MSEGSDSKTADALPPGTVIADRFELVALLGVGGMAEVYRATDRTSGEPVALKLLRKHLSTKPEAVERLRREGDVLSSLDDAAVVSMKSSGTASDGRIYLAMELLEGETLGARMRRGRMEPSELTPILSPLASGLSSAHARDVVHRDLKPENIYLLGDERDDEVRVKILDFGISKVFGREKLTQTGEVLGTPRYMAPEQLTAEHDLDARVDVYALGVILYEALAGQPPFATSGASDLILAILHGKAVPLRSVRPDVGEQLETVVMRAMARAREARYDSADELARAWSEVAAGGEAPAASGEPRAGMRTDALGSMSSPDLADVSSPGEHADAAGRSEGQGGGRPLQIGTFSALQQADAPDEAQQADGGRAQDATAESDSSSSVSAPASASDGSASGASASSAAGASSASDAAPASRKRRPRPGDSQPLEIPMRKPRGLLIAGGLIAGALSAGLVIALLHLFAGGEGGGAAAESPDEAGAAPAEGAGHDDGGARDAGAASGEDAGNAVPHGEAPPPEQDGDETAGARSASARRARTERSPRSASPRSPSRSSSASAQDTDEAAAPEPEPSAGESDRAGSATLLSDARKALSRAEPGRCVELVSEAIDKGAPAFALKLRGECYLRMGDNGKAIGDYKRFCRLAPDHPAIGEVRALVESYGQSCP